MFLTEKKVKSDSIGKKSDVVFLQFPHILYFIFISIPPRVAVIGKTGDAEIKTYG